MPPKWELSSGWPTLRVVRIRSIVSPKEGESIPSSVESVRDLDATVALCVTLANACG